MTYSQHVPAAERTMQILELLAASPEGLVAGDLEANLDIPRSALFALLNTLTQMGYVEQPVARGPYRLGKRLATLVQPQPRPNRTLALAFYDELEAHPFDETVALAVLDERDALVIAEAASGQSVRSAMPAGHRVPAVDSAAGHVLLAGLSSHTREQRFTSLSDAVVASLSKVRRRKAATRESAEVIELAVPVCPNGYQPSAALFAGVPAFRWSSKQGEQYLRELRTMAARISYRLGALAYQPYGSAGAYRLGTSAPMSQQELQAFLGEPWAARLACVRTDGTPHVVPVWYEWTGNAFLVAAWPGSIWAEYVERNPNIALTIDEPWPPMRRVLARGDARVLAADEIPDGRRALLRRLTARYLGTTDRVAVPEAEDESDAKTFRIVPTTMTAKREQIERTV